jgi:hypothetical protein
LLTGNRLCTRRHCPVPADPPLTLRGLDRLLTGREWPRVWLLAVALAVVMTAPVSLHLGSGIADSLEDPLLQAWQVAWGGHALLHQPLHLFDANAFWPERHSLAFSDSLLGYSPAGILGSGPGAAVLRYNLLYLFAYALAFAAAWFLARELGLGLVGATVAATAFAYAPWRASQAGHLHVLSSGGIPLTVFLLLRGYRKRSAAYLVAGWAAAAWQVSLGFSLGLQLLYALLIVAPVIAWYEWLRPRGVRAALRDRSVAVATAGGGLALAAVSVALAVPYLQVRDDHPESRRTLATVKAFSPPPLSFLAAAPENVVWGYRTSAVRSHLYTRGEFASNAEKTLFPGVAVIVLALAGATAGPFARRLRIGLLAASVAFGVLALGTSLGTLSPYRLLYEFAPGWDAIRTPGRLATLMTLTLALLAGAGAERLAPRLRSRNALLVALIPLVVLFEGWAPPVVPHVPGAPAGFASAPAPVLHLPSNRFVDARYMLWSTDGFPPIANGWSGFDPTLLTRIRAVTSGFPADRRGVPLLRRLGVRAVVVHSRRAPARVYRVRP